MRKSKSNPLKALMFSVFALGATATAAQADGTPGIPLAPGQDCGIHVYLSNSGGVVMPKAAGWMSGSYRFRLYQAIPTSDVDINLSGRFSSSADRSTKLAQSAFGLGYVVPGGFRGMDELRDAELGQDAALFGSLQVYDQAGRLSCTTNAVTILPIDLVAGFQRPVVRTAARTYARQPDNARLAHERMAQRRATAPSNYPALTPEQCRRLTMGRRRPAQCN
jgi:hypothetical protein